MALPAALAPRAAGTSVRLALVVAVLSGSFVAVQQRVNGELKDVTGDAVLTALVELRDRAAVPGARAAEPARVPRGGAAAVQHHLVERLAGLGGATLVVAGAAAAPVLGVALLTVGLVAGQTAGGLLVDRVGLGPGGSRPLTAPRVLGGCLCLVAVGISVAGADLGDVSPALLALVVVAGCAVSAQQALNGRVRVATGDAVAATSLNFVVGTAALLLGLALRAALHGIDVLAWPGPGRWYLYTGGLVGAGFVAVGTVVVQRLGVLRLGLAVVAGQLVGAVLLDLLLPAGSGLAASTVLGAALTLVAVAVSGRPSR